MKVISDKFSLQAEGCHSEWAENISNIPIFSKNNKMSIGRILIGKGLLKSSELEEALHMQRSTGSSIINILQGEGKVSTLSLYQAQAEHLGLRFVNLMKELPDQTLLEADERDVYRELKVIPLCNQGELVVLATSDVSKALEFWASEKYSDYVFVITSPFDINWTIQQNFAKEDDEDARDGLWKRDPRHSAKELLLTSRGKIFLLIVLLLLPSLFFLNGSIEALFIAINIFYASTLLIKVWFFGTGVVSEYIKKLHPPIATNAIIDKDLPIYTLLVPMYKEKPETVAHLVTSIRAFDYPKSKLDIKLIVEADDGETIETIKQLGCEKIFEIVRVPFSMPRTKPKACNYALKFAKGAYVTIYDADDRPDPLQLKKVLHTFNEAPSDVVCVQGRLNYYNREENVLTSMFALEYSSWFNFLLPGLQALGIPIPLGGTSNHFPIKVLRKLYAWDPYNVTEDADLGIRLSQLGYRTAIVDSTTLEEAPIGILGWFGQRSRWIKGYMQTYIVHMRNPVHLFKSLGFRGFFGFQFFIGASSLVFLTVPIVVLLSAIAFFDNVALPPWFAYVAMFNFIAGIVVHIAIAVIVVARDKWWALLPHTLLFPFYWVLHMVASFRSVWELIARPHYWQKTEHGLSKFTAKTVNK